MYDDSSVACYYYPCSCTTKVGEVHLSAEDNIGQAQARHFDCLIKHGIPKAFVPSGHHQVICGAIACIQDGSLGILQNDEILIYC